MLESTVESRGSVVNQESTKGRVMCKRERERDFSFYLSAAPWIVHSQQRKKMEEEETQHRSSGAPTPPYIEVNCKASGKVTRFAAGTEAGFAVLTINKKLDIGVAPASYIEAVKGEEEPISFGRSALLVDYGKGWKLQTVHEDADHEIRRVGSFERRFHEGMRTSYSTSSQKEQSIATGFEFSFQYIGKVLLAFCFIFLIGGVLTFMLENLPSLISSVSTSL